MPNSEEFLISITRSLSQAENDLRSLYAINEFEATRNKYISFQNQLKEINGEILKDLDNVYDNENFTSVLDQI